MDRSGRHWIGGEKGGQYWGCTKNIFGAIWHTLVVVERDIMSSHFPLSWSAALTTKSLNHSLPHPAKQLGDCSICEINAMSQKCVCWVQQSEALKVLLFTVHHTYVLLKLREITTLMIEWVGRTTKIARQILGYFWQDQCFSKLRNVI